MMRPLPQEEFGKLVEDTRGVWMPKRFAFDGVSPDIAEAIARKLVECRFVYKDFDAIIDTIFDDVTIMGERYTMSAMAFGVADYDDLYDRVVGQFVPFVAKMLEDIEPGESQIVLGQNVTCIKA